RVVGAEEVAEQVQLAPLVLRRDFDAGDDFQPPSGRGPGVLNRAHRVVVGHGNGGQPAAAGEVHHLGGRVLAVAVGGVQVQVGAAGGGPGGELAEARERLAGRHGSSHRCGGGGRSAVDAVQD